MKTPVLYCAVGPDKLKENYEASKTFGFKSIGDFQKEETLYNPAWIVGGGTSLATTHSWIKSGDVYAIKSVDYLLSKDIVPRFSVHIDPKPTEADLITIHPDVTYLLSTQSDPSVFERLRDHARVYLVPTHSSGLWQPTEGYWFAGTSATAGALLFMREAGYREINFAGVDLSFTDERTHINRDSKHMRQNNEFVTIDGYRTTTVMWGAAMELVRNIKVIGRTSKIKIHGNGLFSHLMKKSA